MREFIVEIKGDYHSDKAVKIVELMKRMGYRYPDRQNPLEKAEIRKYPCTCFRASGSGKIYHSEIEYYSAIYPEIELITCEEFLKTRPLVMITE